MEPLIDVNCSPMECTSLSPSAPICEDSPGTGNDRGTPRRDELLLLIGDQ